MTHSVSCLWNFRKQHALMPLINNAACSKNVKLIIKAVADWWLFTCFIIEVYLSIGSLRLTFNLLNCLPGLCPSGNYQVRFFKRLHNLETILIRRGYRSL